MNGYERTEVDLLRKILDELKKQTELLKDIKTNTTP